MDRIGIIGAAGTGKSSLARAVSKKFGLPKLESKTVTQIILDRDGYDYASGEQIERFLAHGGRQNEILKRTMEQEDESSVSGFVTDRTVIDLAAYVVSELHDTDVPALQHIFDTCRRRIETYTHLFLCQWHDHPMSDNSKRTLSPWYQFNIHAIEIGILEYWECPYHILQSEETESRLEEVEKYLGVTIP